MSERALPLPYTPYPTGAGAGRYATGAGAYTGRGAMFARMNTRGGATAGTATRGTTGVALADTMSRAAKSLSRANECEPEKVRSAPTLRIARNGIVRAETDAPHRVARCGFDQDLVSRREQIFTARRIAPEL